jgi:hypothetical protein
VLQSFITRNELESALSECPCLYTVCARKLSFFFAGKARRESGAADSTPCSFARSDQDSAEVIDLNPWVDQVSILSFI